MKRFMVREARAALTDLLDAAERGEPVVIERRGIVFTLSAAAARTRARRSPTIARVDRALAGGEWSWEWTPDGLVLDERRRP
jgi:prevent-host-death family protein